MAKYSKRHPEADDKNQEEAMKIARGTQKTGQSKEHTKLIAQGIQKGIEQYKKQHKSKARDLSKQLKSVAKSKENAVEPEIVETVIVKQHWLPWSLLVVSWLGFAFVYFMPTF
jgi:flagellar biosynthesis/type III secretory pathway protein FliH